MSTEALPSNYRPTNCPNLAPPTQAGVRKGYNLFVGTLPKEITKDELEILFSPFGTLSDTYLLKQEGKGNWRCGFVSYTGYASAAHAIAVLNGFKIQERVPPMCVRFANPPKIEESNNTNAASTAAAVADARRILEPAANTSFMPFSVDDNSSVTSSLGPESSAHTPSGRDRMALSFSQAA
eukprot:TRINITY_DN9967_c0_g1_i1.p1 TRINITY_DN9967_c0_g1~~TRINITY_DN9967_c0_g1_i1.p1  ORF type:complete len:201 (+),score=46.15 TRINITY_DN9967_c0_g1_i1:61-603(+)